MIPHIEPDWPAPANVVALSTTRAGGVSEGPWHSLNLGDHVGDRPAAVAENRRRLQARLPSGMQLQWLSQVHGSACIRDDASGTPEADACWTDTPGVMCAVLTADCLPLLLADRAGIAVAAVHAGWRGLCAGVIEATVDAMPCAPGELMAWLGPAIGPAAFEVGPEVREAFLARDAAAGVAFEASARAGHYLASLDVLARQRLAGAGVSAIHGGGQCTYDKAGQFFSYRRDGQTGRMATLIGLRKAP